MDFFTSLLKAYEKAEEIGLVDQQTGENDPVLLPIYHDNKIIKNNDNNLFIVYSFHNLIIGSVRFSVIKCYGFLRNVHRFGDEVLAGMFCKNFLF